MNNAQKLREIKKLNVHHSVLEASFREESQLIKQRKLEIIKSVVVKCTRCNTRHTFGKFGFVQDYWYISSRGCNEGGYWKMSGTEVCYIVCPKCSRMVYICNHPMRDWIVGVVDSHEFTLEKLFSAVWDQDGDREPKPRAK